MFRSTIRAGLFWLLASSPALADRIDGNWCSEDGVKRLTIRGPEIVIPSGRQITGTYTRHEFEYSGPDGDPEAGQQIHMVQQSEELVFLYRSSQPDTFEEWHRCQAIS